MKIFNKIVLKQLLTIVFVSIVLALLYNYQSDKNIPLYGEIPKKNINNVTETVSDSVLLAMLSSNNGQEKAINPPVDPLEAIDSDIIEDDDSESAHTTVTDTTLKSTPSASEAQTAKYKEIKYDLMLRYLDNQNIVIVDARSSEAYEKGHIGNALNIHPYDDENVYYGKLVALPTDKLIIIYCDGGDCDLSHHVANDLIKFNFKNILLYVGGWEEWSKKKNS